MKINILSVKISRYFLGLQLLGVDIILHSVMGEEGKVGEHLETVSWDRKRER